MNHGTSYGMSNGFAINGFLNVAYGFVNDIMVVTY